MKTGRTAAVAAGCCWPVAMLAVAAVVVCANPSSAVEAAFHRPTGMRRPSATHQPQQQQSHPSLCLQQQQQQYVTSLLARKKTRRPREKERSRLEASILEDVPSEEDIDNDNNDNPTPKKDTASYQKKPPLKTYPARFLEDNGIQLATDDEGRVRAQRGAPLSREPHGSSSSGDDMAATLVDYSLKSTIENVRVGETVTFKIEADGTILESVTTKSKEPTAVMSTSKTTSEKKPTVARVIHTNSTATTTDVATTTVTTDTEEEATAEEAPPKKRRGLPPIFKRARNPQMLMEQPAKVVPQSGFNVVLTHCTADFDSLASAVGLAKLWASTMDDENDENDDKRAPRMNADDRLKKDFDSASHVPTFVVLPRGAHPGVQRFLALHKHLFPIRSLRSLPDDLTGLNRLGLVDAQRRDRIGPAENLLQYAKRVTVVDHHIDSDTDIPEATDYVVDKVGSVSTMIAERLQQAGLELTEAEATLLALGIHADTGSLCFDSTTPRDAISLAWVMSQGASQAAIAEHAQSSLSPEQQGVLTQALINTNSTVVHGVTLSSVLLSADGFINGLAAVTQDALELSSSDLFLLAVVYEAQSGGKRRSKGKKSSVQGEKLTARLMSKIEDSLPVMKENFNHAGTESNATKLASNLPQANETYTAEEMAQAQTVFAEAWRGGEDAMRRQRLQAAFDRNDLDSSGYLEYKEIAATLAGSGIITSEKSIRELMDSIDTDGDGKINFDEFVNFTIDAEKRQQELTASGEADASKPSTMIIIGRVKAGVNMKGVKLNRLLEKFGGGGHAKAASATVRLSDESEAEGVLEGLIDEIIETSLQEQVTVGDFMTAPVLSVKPDMTEKQVEDLFTRYDVRALPVVDEANEVIGLVTYKEVAAAKQRMWNKEQKKLRREKEAAEKGIEIPYQENKVNKERQRKSGSTVKGWMKQHVRLVEDSTTMAEMEAILLESDVGCIPVVAEGTKILIGMVTRTDLLRQHRYYPTLHYHNKGFADSISARKPIIELRKRLKKFDLENE